MTSTGYSQTPRLLKGALIYFGAPMLVPLPNVIPFQYNPESMTRALVPWQPIAREITIDETTHAARRAEVTDQQRYSLSQPYDPQETLSLALELDATDALEHPEAHPVALVSGIADRIAAIEMLMYPPGDNLLGSLLGTVTASVSFGSGGGIGNPFDAGSTAALRDRKVPIVLFFWGPGRIVPVRITSLQIEEQQFSPTLFPVRARATLGVRVLTEEDLVTVQGDPATGAEVELARACYRFTRGQKELLAVANLANVLESVGVLPV